MKKYHRSDGNTEITLPKPEDAYINFDITRESDLVKTEWLRFVTFFDFEASTVVRDGQKIQIPNSYCIFSPELMDLTDTKLHQESYLKIGYSDDPDELLRKFVKDISDLHHTHIIRLQAHRELPPLSAEEKFRYDICRLEGNWHSSDSSRGFPLT
jgi:hypothetical protein